MACNGKTQKYLYQKHLEAHGHNLNFYYRLVASSNVKTLPMQTTSKWVNGQTLTLNKFEGLVICGSFKQ